MSLLVQVRKYGVGLCSSERASERGQQSGTEPSRGSPGTRSRDRAPRWGPRAAVEAATAGRGAWTLDGAMIDAPVTGKARALVDKARRCGIDVAALQEKWKDQEPSENSWEAAWTFRNVPDILVEYKKKHGLR